MICLEKYRLDVIIIQILRPIHLPDGVARFGIQCRNELDVYTLEVHDKQILEQHGRGLELSALREKIRALEMLTRNAVTNDSIEKRFSEVMEQARRVDRLSRTPADKQRERPKNPDH